MSILENNIEYTKSKSKYHFTKVALLAIMGGFFVALGYVGYFAIHSLDIKADPTTKAITKVVASALFPTGLIMCVFMGGSLFTSDSMLSIAWWKKYMTLPRLLLVWTTVWCFNFVGSTIAATVSEFGHVFAGKTGEELMHVAQSKASLEWYEDFFSGILCNMLVAGSIFMANGVKNSGTKIALIWFPITLFVLAGFQHTVANQFVFVSAWIHEARNGGPTIDSAGAVQNLALSAMGNWLAGAVIIPGIYLLVEHFGGKKIQWFTNTVSIKHPEIKIKNITPDITNKNK